MPREHRIVSVDWEGVAALTMIVFLLSAVAAYITHLVWIVQMLASDAGMTAGKVLLSVFGTLFFPLGILHGYVIWFT